MRISNAEHERHPWLIARIAPDFELLDAWALPAHGGADEFPALIGIVTALDPTGGRWSGATRALFSLRLRLGSWLGWDRPEGTLPIPGRSETSLSARVPDGMRDTSTRATTVGGATFVPLYKTNDEWAAEISNRTVHGVLQLAWIDEGHGDHGGRLGVYVKPRGALGAAYMALIGPFRHLIVYPELMRQVERAWKARPHGTGRGGDPSWQLRGDRPCPGSRQSSARGSPWPPSSKQVTHAARRGSSRVRCSPTRAAST